MTATATEEEIVRFHLEVGDVVITKDSESWDDIAIPAFVEATADDLICGYHLAFIRPNREMLDGRFLFRCVQSRPVALQLELEATGVTRYGLPKGAIGSALLPLPSLRLQYLIANYLDRETERIDALMVEKEHMLVLLEEKRTALISRAVTRGLNPDVTLIPSGLDWLGDIPAHWGTPPVYARFEVQLGKMLDEKKIKGTHLSPYLRNVDVQWGKINISSLPEMDFDDESRVRYTLQPGDILVCEGGEIGRSAIWFGEIVECYYQKALHRLRPLNGHDDTYFFVYVMQTLVNLCVFSSLANAATIQHLPAEKLRTVRYPAPPIHEQREIVSFLNRETAYLKKLNCEITHSIQLLKEHRAALITAAVTGQIPNEEMNA
jgi:type I restriction enzyme S subunit